MAIGLAFWVILLVWAIFGIAVPAPGSAPRTWRDFGGTGLLFVLFLLVGWQLFGQPLHK